jgi:surface protein
MKYMFVRAKVFNQDISGWDTSKVTNKSGMFLNAAAYNAKA